MFGVKYPIICGAMMWLCKPKLCAAVSNAGGIGNLTAGNYETADEFRAAIRETRKLTDKPFFVAITLLPSVRITPEHHKMYVKVCAEEKVAGIEFSGTPLDKVAGMEAVEHVEKCRRERCFIKSVRCVTRCMPKKSALTAFTRQALKKAAIR